MRVLYNLDDNNEDTRRAVIGELSFQIIDKAQSMRERKIWGKPENVTVGEWNATRKLVDERRAELGLPLSGGGTSVVTQSSVDLTPVLDAIGGVPTAEQNGAAARAAIVK